MPTSPEIEELRRAATEHRDALQVLRQAETRLSKAIRAASHRTDLQTIAREAKLSAQRVSEITRGRS